MKISIIVTAYENPGLLNDTLYSIKRFVGIDDYEVIVVDGSKGNEMFNIYKEYIPTIQHHISYVRLMNNDINDMRNTGLHLASGEYILFLMAGDEILRDFIPIATEEMDKNEYGLYVTAYYNEDGEYESSYFQDSKIGPILCITIIRKSLIPIDFHWLACGDNILTGIILNNGVYYYVSPDVGVEYKESAYQWMNDRCTKALNVIGVDWMDYVYAQVGRSWSNIDVSVHVTNRCNKNCVACGHFAPLVPNSDPDLTPEEFNKSMLALHRHRDIVRKLILTGGEPTINPHCMEIVRIAHKYFHDVRLVSNGLNPQFFEENAQELMDLNIEVYITNYKKELVDKIRQYLPCGRYTIPNLENEDDERVYFYSGMLSNEKQTEHTDLIGQCGRYCSQLVGTRLYLCQYTANFKYFDDFFKDKHQLPSVEDSYIDLATTQLNNMDIKDFIFNHVCEMCWHCREHYNHNNLEGGCDSVKLCNSKQDINEWIKG